MFATATCCALRGLAGVPVTVEADVTNGLPNFTIVGLTDRAIQEARERVRAAVRNAGFEFPQRRLTVNLAPAELPKEGTAFDLAIALAVVISTGRELQLGGTAVLGELALDAQLRPVLGVLPMARALRLAGVTRVVVPVENASEAALVDDLEVFGAPTLAACVAHFSGEPLPRTRRGSAPAPPEVNEGDLAAVRGQGMAKRALEIAAAGGHNVLMIGPPGTGKTMLARALASILPDLGADAGLEVGAIYSLRGALRDRPATVTRPPFRAPHHTISRAGLVGGGSGLAQPGEISLAHRGVLFLDELCEFPRSLLEALRQPLEEGAVTIVRSRGGVRLPAAFSLVAAANPCPCGHLDDPHQACECRPLDVVRYRSRLSGPLRDRIDLAVAVPRQNFGALFGEGAGEETSSAVRARVEAARERQLARNAALRAGCRRPRRATGDPWPSDALLNAELDGRILLAACRPTIEASRHLADAGERLALSARAYHRVLRVARTLADLEDVDRVDRHQISEAIRFRGQAAA